MFADAPVPKLILRFMVKEYLEDRHYQLDRKTIAEALKKFSEGAIGTGIGRLRKKLEVYYKGVGQSESIRIEVPLHGCVPKIFVVSSPGNGEGEEPAKEEIPDGENATESLRPATRTSASVLGNLTPDFTSTFESARVAAVVAFEEGRHEEVLRITGVLLEIVDDPGQTHLKALPLIYFMRFNAFLALGRIESLSAEDVQTALDMTTVDEAGGATCAQILGFALFVSVLTHNTAHVDEFRSRLVELVVDSPDFGGVAGIPILWAMRLAGRSLYEPANQLIYAFINKLRPHHDPEKRRAHAHARYLNVAYLLALNQFENTLKGYYEMEKELADNFTADVVSNLTWAGTEATRALRHLGRHEDADMMAHSLLERFRSETKIETQRALAFASYERNATYFKRGDYAQAINICKDAIESWNSPSLELQLPRVEAYNAWIACLRELKSHEQAMDLCETVVALFGNSTDMDVQAKVAWAMVEKAAALRGLKHLAASRAAAREVTTRFEGTTHEGIMGQLAWAVHQEGDTLLCEGKFRLRSGLLDDATEMFNTARERFLEAHSRDPEEPKHLFCQSYTEFLLGHKSDAESTFKRAEFADSWWLEKTQRECAWTELVTFPVPQDEEFVKAVNVWRT